MFTRIKKCLQTFLEKNINTFSEVFRGFQRSEIYVNYFCYSFLQNQKTLELEILVNLFAL